MGRENLDRGLKFSSINSLDLVKLRNGGIYVVFTDALVSFDDKLKEDFPIMFNSYNNNCTNKNDRDLDIVEIRTYNDYIMDKKLNFFNVEIRNLFNSNNELISYQKTTEPIEWKYLKPGTEISIVGDIFDFYKMGTFGEEIINKAKFIDSTVNKNNEEIVIFKYYDKVTNKDYICYANTAHADIKLLEE